jgi:hypothetical protein
MPREGGASSTPRPIVPITAVSAYWIAQSSRAMTASGISITIKQPLRHFAKLRIIMRQ